MKVLVVEDNLVNQKIVAAILKKNSIEYRIANDGNEAIEMAKIEEYPIILMDCQLPGVDGYDATIAIRNNEAICERKRSKIIALTANAMSGDRDKCIEVGMDDFLSKPFNSQQLIELIQKASIRNHGLP